MMARLFQNYGAEVLFSTGRGGLTILCNDHRDLKCFQPCALPPSHLSRFLWQWYVRADRGQSRACSVTSVTWRRHGSLSTMETPRELSDHRAMQAIASTLLSEHQDQLSAPQ